MQFQSMLPGENLEIISDLRRAKKCKHDNVRFHLRRKKLVNLPPNINNVSHIKRVEFDLSYNKTLDHSSAFKQLAELGNVHGLGLIKHEKGVLDESIGLLDKLEVLNLWSNGLKALPDSFSKLKKLKVLNLRNNSLKKIPDYFSEFKDLRYLNLQFNRIKKVPDLIYDLTNLEELNLATCGLTELSPRLGNLKNLKRLNISKNSILNLPDSFSDLPLEQITFYPAKKADLEQYISVLSKAKHLKKLDLSNIGLEELPANIGLLQQVEELDISRNKIKYLPESFGKLKLKTLRINGNPFDIHQTLPILGGLESYTEFRNADFAIYKNTDLIEIPDSIGKCQFIKNFRIGNKSDFSISDRIANCASLESLTLYSTDIKTLPECIGKIPNLKNLRVASNNSLTELGDWIYDMHHLETFNFQNNGVKLDPVKAKGLKGLSVWHIEEPTEDAFKATLDMPNIKQITFNRILKPFAFPEVFYQNKNLEIINLNSIQQLDLSSFFKNISRLKKIKELYFYYSHLLDINQLAEVANGLPALEKLHCVSSTHISDASLMVFKSLQEFNLEIRIDRKFMNKLPPSYLNFPKGVLKLNRYGTYVSQLDEIIDNIKNEITEPHHELAYMLKLKSYEALSKKYPSPFEKSDSLEGKVIYVASSPSSGTLTELRNKLSERGAKIAKKMTADVTDIFITPKLKEDFDLEIVGDYNYILEDYLKAMELKEDTPYLMEEVNEELIAQITNLMKSKEDNQLPLIVELISGGGATKKLNSYLMAIHLFAKDVNLRKSARNLFRKYASSDLQAHIKKVWKDGFKKQIELSRFGTLLTHDDIDVAAFILAWQVTKYFHPENKLEPRVLQHLKLGTLEGVLLTDSFKDINHVKYLSITSTLSISHQEIYGHIKNNPLENLTMNIGFSSTPTKLINFEGMKSLTLGNWQTRSYMDLNELEREVSEVTHLALTNVELKNCTNLSLFPNLERLVFTKCDIDTLDGIKALTKLKYFNLNKCNIPNNTINSDIESLVSLEHLQIVESNLERIDCNFSVFSKLRDISLPKNLLTSIPDTFKGSMSIDRVNFSENELSSLPRSLFETKGQHTWSQINIAASKNKITSIGGTSSKKSLFSKLFKGPKSNLESTTKKINRLELSDNKLDAIPDFLFNQPIVSLVLNNNPIKQIPNVNLDSIETIGIQSKVLEEVPLHIFGVKTNFGIHVESNDTKLPSPADLSKFNNVSLYAYQLPAVKEKILEIDKKKIPRA